MVLQFFVVLPPILIGLLIWYIIVRCCPCDCIKDMSAKLCHAMTYAFLFGLVLFLYGYAVLRRS